MANIVAGNTIYIDSTGAVSVDKNKNIVGIIYNTSSATNAIVISDNSSTPRTRLKIIDPASSITKYFDLSGAPIGLQNGLNITTLTAATATIITASRGG